MSDLLPLSPLQQRMWDAELTTSSARENVFGLLELDGPFSDTDLRLAIRDVFRRQEALRVRIEADEGVLQSVHPDLPDVDVEEVDSFEECCAIGEELASKRIELRSDPLWRLRLLRVGNFRYVAYAFHHIVVDGWSLNVFADDVRDALESHAGLAPPSSPIPREWTHREIVSRQLAEHDGPAWNETLKHWTKTMPSPLPVLGMPSSRPRRENSDGIGESFNRQIDVESWQNLGSFARAHRTTTFAALAAVVATAVADQAGTGDDPVIFGVPFHGRLKPGSRRTIGYMANMVPIVLEGARRGPAEAIYSARRALTSAFAHAQVPPEDVGQHVYGSPVLPYRFCLNMKLPTRSAAVAHAIKMRGVPIGNDAANFDYELFVAPESQGARASLCWDVGGFDRNDAEAFWDAIERWWPDA